MNKQMFDALADAITKEALGSHYAFLLDQANAALERLDAASREYREAIEETGKLALVHSDIKDLYDPIRAELELELIFDRDVVTGKSKEIRERQVAAYLGRLLRNGNPTRQLERDFIRLHAEEGAARQRLDVAKFFEESAKKEHETARRQAWLLSKMLPVVETM